VPPGDVIHPELARSLALLSSETGRQIGLLVNRSGQIEHTIVGGSKRVLLPDFGRIRASTGRLRGLRLVHTHLGSAGVDHDDLVDLLRLRLDLVAALSVGPDGEPEAMHIAHLLPDVKSAVKGSEPWTFLGPFKPGQASFDFLELIRTLEEDFAEHHDAVPVVAPSGRGLLVHVAMRNGVDPEESLQELAELAKAAGVEVADRVIQRRDQVDPRTVIGKGKLEEVVLLCLQHDADLLIFDRNISPLQGRTIAELTDLKVIDRTQLILDIFAQRAASLDGKLQVELAQLKYRLPRLAERDDGLSRLTGGIGGRGPGETKLEIGRRRARERIARLERELEKLSKQRRQRRILRHRRGTPIVTLVGYTNTGKSTLLNALTRSSAQVEDRPFVTLDPLSRRLRLLSGVEVILIDTVGFIRDLPQDLIAAFRATLEEAGEADLLLNVVDASSPVREELLRCVEELLQDLGFHEVPRLLVWNKCDLLPADAVSTIRKRYGGVAVSAITPSTLSALLGAIEERIEG